MTQGIKPSSISFSRALLASAMMLITLLVVNYFVLFKEVNPIKPLAEFPTRIGSWSGKVDHFEQRIYDILGVDDAFLCDYRLPDGGQIQLYIGYYMSQRQGDMIHSPKHCMPGAGWDITKTSIEPLSVPGTNPARKHIIRLILEKDGKKQVALYWFQSRGRIISSEYWEKVYLVWDAIIKHRTDGSFVRLISPIIEDEAETTRDMTQFAKELFPILDQFLPGSEAS
ncbi:conserved hypothetical protein [uncultured Desulfobacterium sp.]|uniref:Methanolan biosynthesis EpsI domain-containing protein n=1 Tax=uncultured Desulfobacterium sp. TaxID=201089 RepID=A0A445MZX5_9BACT|nr:conserved hypothetical protein [uncultured Desulfobacterium sp.]